jgi:hypothetical protein
MLGDVESMRPWTAQNGPVDEYEYVEFVKRFGGSALTPEGKLKQPGEFSDPVFGRAAEVVYETGSLPRELRRAVARRKHELGMLPVGGAREPAPQAEGRQVPGERVPPDARPEWLETLRALGSYEGSWRAAFSPRRTGSASYYSDYLDRMTGWKSIAGALPSLYSARGMDPLWTARGYYTLTDGRFTNWGRSSKVLVPNMVKRIGPWAAGANAVSTAAVFWQSMHAMSKSAGELVWNE